MKSVRLVQTLMILLLAVLVGTTSASQKSGGAQWGYEGAEGPAQWGSLSPDFSMCTSGVSQSPIDIAQTVKVDLGSLLFDYKDSPLRIINNGHTIQVNLGAGSFMQVMGKTYEVLQFHFHSPSENTVHGSPLAWRSIWSIKTRPANWPLSGC